VNLWSLLLLGVPAVPVLHAVVARVRPEGPVPRPWSALPALAAVLVLPQGFQVEVPWLLLGASFGLDAMARVFLFFTALLWLLAGAYARRYVEKDRRGFALAYLLAMGGNLGLVVAQDALGFYVFFTLMSFACYRLVVHRRDAKALLAGRVYIVLVIVGELALFVALLLAVFEAGGASFVALADAIAHSPWRDGIMALALIAFGIKAGLFFLHMWLPMAHPVAPTPASAVLSGAMTKAGLLGWLRLFPAGFGEWGPLLVVAGLAGACLGVLFGCLQRDAKTLLAYSSVSQMGLAIAALGAGASEGVVLFALHHALAKGALFLGTGVAERASKRSWWVALGLILPALALAGAPFTSGMVVKATFKEQLPGSLLALASFATTLLMARFLVLAWPRANRERAPLPAGLWAPWALLVAAAAVGVWLVPLHRPALSGSDVLASLWPVALGGALGAACARFARRPVPVVPAGDLIVLLLPLGRALLRAGVGFAAACTRGRDRLAAAMRRRWHGPLHARRLAAAEVRLTAWTVSTILFVFLCILLALIAA